MVWPRSPLPARGLHSSIDDYRSELDESDDVDEGESANWTPRSSHTYRTQPFTPVATPQKPPFQPSYVYDEREEARVLQTEHRAARLRNCAMSLMDRIEKAAMVQFKITPKPHVMLERYGKRREETSDFYGLTFVHGEFFPSVSDDQGAAHRMSFNGWIRAYTNTSASFDIVLSNHRGYRIMRSAPLRVARSRCATFDDLPPLHYLRSSAECAFGAQDWASFRMNCSRVDQAPVEIVFAHIPFVFCPEDLVSSSFSAVLRGANESESSPQSQTLWVHGERMLVEIVLISSKEEAMQARSQPKSLEMWGNSTTSSSPRIATCPYLEAPLASYTPRSSQLINDLFGNASLPRSSLRTESSPPNATFS